MTDGQRALRELEKRLEKEPDNLSLRVTVAGMLSEIGRKDEAVELYRSVALAYREQGRGQQAIAVCRSILELAPDDIAIHALVAELTTRAASHDQEPAIEIARPADGTPRPAQPVQPVHATQPPKPRAASQPPVAAALISRPLVPSPAGVKTPPRPPPVRTPPVGLPAEKSTGGSIPGVPRRTPGELDTPLPNPVPYHVADPTSSPMKVPPDDPGDPDDSGNTGDQASREDSVVTRPGGDPAERPGLTGLAQAARRISGLIAQDQLPSQHDDLLVELDTRQVPRLSVEDLEKVSLPPPTVPVEMVDEDDLRDLATPIPSPSPRAERASGLWRPAASLAVPIRDTPVDPPTDLNLVGSRPEMESDDELTSPRELQVADPLANAFFVALPANRRDVALSRCMKKSARAGATVIRQGETSHPLILVVLGKLELRVERPNGTLAILDTIDTGQYIGEAALLGRTPASANVIAMIDCELLALPPHALFELAGAYPALWAALKDTAERRTRQYDKLIRAST